MPSNKPEPREAALYYQSYIRKADGVSLHHALGHASAVLHKTLEAVKGDKAEYRYAEGKWTIKDIVQHIIDCERVFAYRALRFARHDSTELPGFDENDYAASSSTERRSLADLLEERWPNWYRRGYRPYRRSISCLLCLNYLPTRKKAPRWNFNHSRKAFLCPPLNTRGAGRHSFSGLCI